MKVIGKNGVGSILKVILQLSMVLGIVFLISLYWIVKSVKLNFNWFTACIYPCGISFLILVYQFIGLFNSLKESNPFCKENPKRMNIGMIASFITCIFIIIALLLTIFVYDIYTLELKVALTFIAILFFGVSIALYILKELFIEAINYKEENELTI